MATPEPLDVPNGLADEFVTVVNVQPTTATSSAESFVTVLSIGAGKRGAPSDDKTQPASNGVDPAHPEEEVDIYRLPGERLGFGLKFEGGNKTSERVRRLFVQSCAEQSPASRAKCSWGHLGEGDEVLSIDGVAVTEMTRLDCVRRLKESQLVIKLLVRYRGALRPEVVSAERKHDQHQQRSKIPPELPAAPPPVPPRKSRHSTQSANRGPADGEASPGGKKPWDSPKSAGSSQNGSPQSQGSYRSAASSGTRSSTYESCASSPAKSIPGSKNESPKAHVSPVLSKTKQEPPAEAQWYLDARSQDGSSTHGSTSDDTSSSLSTVVDRFSSSDRFSTTSTASTTSEQQLYHPADIAPDLLDDALLTPATTAPSVATTNGCCSDLSSPDFLLARLANSEARTHVESRGDVERVTTVVAPNTVLIEETPALQPPLCFQDAPLSYGHEPRPGIFYTADLAADSRTHFRPIKDDAEMVEKVVNGDRVAPPLPARNHVNRIPVNQQMKQPTNGEERKEEEVEETKTSPQLPPKPMPRKDVKAKRKRPPPPPPPPRRENPPPVPEARHFDSCGGTKKVEMVKTDSEAGEENTSRLSVEVVVEDRQRDEEVEAEGTPKTNKVLEIVEMRKAIALPPQKAPSRTSVADEVPEGRDGASTSQGVEEGNVHGVEEISACQRALLEMHVVNTVSIDVEDSEDGDGGTEGFEEKNGKKWEVETEDEVVQVVDEEETSGFREKRMEDVQDIVQLNTVENVRLLDAIRDGAKESMDEGEISDESDGEDYYWQSNLATIGEEEENNSLEYDEANEISVPPVTKPLEKPQIIEDIVETALPALSDKI
ncbi:uncharacterized protein LOC106646158, partial [Copidosoma floridanum]|uniref:uncharacterized protein LOC106646158 n=1 Tax=Copidosoma floridanum TaxID=29053 RepID=UPI0006C987E7